MRKRILATIVLLVLMSIMILTASAMTFSDVPATDWFADAVYTSVDLGLINGKEREPPERTILTRTGTSPCPKKLKLIWPTIPFGIFSTPVPMCLARKLGRPGTPGRN